MKYRKIADSDLNLSAIAFGAWAAGGWMWGGTEQNDSIRAIEAAFDNGINAIDTAPIYGQGVSEEIVGEALLGIPRDKVYILTKYGMRWDLAKGDFAMHSQDNRGRPIDVYKYAGAESIIKECEDSLRRLRTDYIDLYQIHWPDSTTSIEESMKAVESLVKSGKIRYAGVCNYNRAKLEEAMKFAPVVSNQVPYSMVRRDIENELVPFCIQNKKSILAYSPMERGLLTGKMKPGHEFGTGDHRASHPAFKEENLRRVNKFLDSVRYIAQAHKLSLGQLVLNWTVHQPGITIALAGARTPEQSIQNAKALNVMLGHDELDFITEGLQNLQLVR
ncbi:aldo/keto reductase [Flavobacterium silvaticum]|uniref:Aldo/keto reductase n=1 Tax=Flavobacterium silvaticum TaxID=1852020 RepID=A0A972FJU9_9FLAO|nr:aldo/keto reductase [Flavobacterium silvaticum]NMH27301.1 aldo/keto reductase [Flavobacterium silvaticum]